MRVESDDVLRLDRVLYVDYMLLHLFEDGDELGIDDISHNIRAFPLVVVENECRDSVLTLTRITSRRHLTHRNLCDLDVLSVVELLLEDLSLFNAFDHLDFVSVDAFLQMKDLHLFRVSLANFLNDFLFRLLFPFETSEVLAYSVYVLTHLPALATAAVTGVDMRAAFTVDASEGTNTGFSGSFGRALVLLSGDFEARWAPFVLDGPLFLRRLAFVVAEKELVGLFNTFLVSSNHVDHAHASLAAAKWFTSVIRPRKCGTVCCQESHKQMWSSTNYLYEGRQDTGPLNTVQGLRRSSKGNKNLFVSAECSIPFGHRFFNFCFLYFGSVDLEEQLFRCTRPLDLKRTVTAVSSASPIWLAEGME